MGAGNVPSPLGLLARLGGAERICAELSPVRRAALLIVSLLLATLVWIPSIHFFFTPRLSDFVSAQGLAPKARAIARAQLRGWEDPAQRAEDLKKMRASNSEWDFMGRTFFVLALANMAMREPETKPARLEVMDAIIGETLRIEREKGMFFFLMDYAKSGAYVDRPARSLFIDGEIALMLGARRMAEEKPEYIPLLAERCEIIQASLTRHPNMLAESYPNECWIFDHLMALDALKLRDVLDGSDHSALIKQWIDLAKREKLHPATGLIHSALTLEGEILDGPEGTTIWIAAHCLKILDEDFAADQYARARREIGFDILGFGLAREWPASWHGRADIDSGPIIPIVGASAGSSGLAILGAAAFDDRQWLGELAASLNFAAFPRERDGALKYCASNQVGDAVMLYALTFGPLWQAVKEKDKR